MLLSIWGGVANRGKTLLLGVGLCGLLTIGLGAVNNFIVYLGIMILLGVALSPAQTTVTTLLQERSDPAMQGRVFGLMSTMYSGFLLIGMTFFGPMADKVSLPLLMIITGGILALIAVLYRMDRAFYRKPEVQSAD